MESPSSTASTVEPPLGFIVQAEEPSSSSASLEFLKDKPVSEKAICIDQQHNKVDQQQQDIPATTNNSNNTSVELPKEKADLQRHHQHHHSCEHAPNVDKKTNSTIVHQVRFGVIYIRTYPTIIGDNPSPVRGPPIAIGWKPVQEQTLVVKVDEYEENRPPRKKGIQHLVLKAKVREKMLRDVGFTWEQINEAVEAKRRARILRQETVHGLKWAWKEEKQEERQELLRRLFSCRSQNNNKKPLDYPETRLARKYYNPSRPVKPMFENLPCIDCASRIVHGPGSDLPAMVYMFYCDGQMCQNQNDAICPFTGETFGEMMKEASVEC